MNESIDAYMAGIIDGEGTVAVYRGRGRSRHLSVTNTDRGLIDWIKYHYPGAGEYEVAPPQPHHKIKWVLTWTSKDAIREVLERIRPYMVVKAQAADRVLADIENAPGMGRPGVRRKSHCVRGHDVREIPAGVTCPQCRKIQNREAYERRKAKG